MVRCWFNVGSILTQLTLLHDYLCLCLTSDASILLSKDKKKQHPPFHKEGLPN